MRKIVLLIAIICVLSQAAVVGATGVQHILSPQNVCAIHLSKAVPIEVLMKGAVQLQGDARALDYSPAVYAAIDESLGGDITPERLGALQAALYKELGRERYDEILGSYLSGARQAAVVTRIVRPYEVEDMRDMNRGWAWKILSDNHPIFKGPEYLAGLMRLSGISGSGMAGADPIRARQRFAEEWEKIAPPFVRSPQNFFLTGSDAVSSFYTIARRHYAKAHNVSEHEAPEVELLALEGTWIASRGKGAALSSLMRVNEVTRDRVLPNPTTYSLHVTDAAELRRLKAAEDETIVQLRERVTKSTAPIGGIVIEPILGAKGVRFYRRDFLLRLREEADRLGILIFADEVLSCGGRTGKFLAIEHYPGFEPDYIAIGKGLQLAGVASVHRTNRKDTNLFARGDGVTLAHYPEIFWKSAFIMKGLREGKLIEQVLHNGEYFLKRLRERYRANLELVRAKYPTSKELQRLLPDGINPDWDVDPEFLPRGLGALLYLPPPYIHAQRSDYNFVAGESMENPFARELPTIKVKMAIGRLMFRLDMTREQIDKLFE